MEFLLMGGQACVFYGAAEFSRDADIVLLCEPGNLARLRRALADLQAECIAVPPFEEQYLRRGHAVHFRCGHPEVAGLRVDAMSVLRGVEPFPVLWARRATVETRDGEQYDLLALRDLVFAKKTQRDKDWPMLRRLVEADYAVHEADPTPEHVEFWLREARTPSLLRTVAARFPAQKDQVEAARPLLRRLAEPDSAVEQALAREADEERARDRAYWAPLVAELEQLRHLAAARRRG